MTLNGRSSCIAPIYLRPSEMSKRKYPEFRYGFPNSRLLFDIRPALPSILISLNRCTPILAGRHSRTVLFTELLILRCMLRMIDFSRALIDVSWTLHSFSVFPFMRYELLPERWSLLVRELEMSDNQHQGDLALP